MTTRHPRSARFGPKWWDRYGHVSFYRPETGWVTWGCTSKDSEAFEWPRPCAICNTEVEWNHGPALITPNERDRGIE